VITNFTVGSQRLQADYIWLGKTADEEKSETLMRPVECPLPRNNWTPLVATDFFIFNESIKLGTNGVVTPEEEI
jgi:hypothetical protein